MLGKVCVRVEYDAEQTVERDAEPRNGKMFDFFQIV